MIGGRFSVLERSINIDGCCEASCGSVEGLVEGGGCNVGVDVGERNLHKLGDRWERLGMGREEEAMHGGELLFYAGERAGNGVQFDLKHLVRRAVDHVI